MAEAKKKPGRPPGSKNKNSNTGSRSSKSGSGSSGGGSGSKSRAKAKVEQIQAKKKADKRVMDEIWAIIAIAIGVFLIVATFTKGAGEFGAIIGDGLKGILGFIAYIFPFYIILYGVLLFAKKTVHISFKSAALLLVFLVMLTIMNSVHFLKPADMQLSWDVMKSYYGTGVTLESGGFIGMVCAAVLVKWFGKAGCWIFAIVMVLISGLLLINTPVSRFISKIGEKMEERKLLKEHAHLDYMSEDEQGVQLALNDVKAKHTKKPVLEKKVTVINSSVLEEKKKGGEQPAQGGTGLPSTGLADMGISGADVVSASPQNTSSQGLPDQPFLIVSGMNVDSDQESAAEPEPEVPRRLYIPPSQVEPLSPEKKNSILKYMNDDSLFGRKASASGSMGLEDKVDYGEGYGLDGRPASSQTGSVGLGTGLGSMPLGFGIPAGSGRAQKPEADSAGEEVKPVGRDFAGFEKASGLQMEMPEAAKPVNPVSGSNSFVNRAGEKIDPNAPKGIGSQTASGAQPAGGAFAAGTQASGGTPAAELQKVISNKEAREAMLTTEELEAAAKPVKVYEMPPINLLTRSAAASRTNSSALQAKAMKLEETLKNFHVDARVVQVTQGPTVTRYEVQPAVGVKVSSIVRLSDDIALNLEARSIRIEAPIPGKAAVGIEVENESITMVKLRDIIDSKEFKNAKSKITFAVGKDISGNNIVADLKSMPHLLIAGSTGSGKSVCINSIILSLLYKANPDEVKLILVDPKVVELGNYNGIPHLLIPVVTDPSKAAAALNWAVAEMTDRYKKFAENGVRDLETYNEAMRADGENDKVMPQVVIIIDELADLMMTAPSQIEESIGRLAQMARAAGMHLIIATQRPSVDVITGTIKSNIGSRIAFAVSSQIDSRTILDMQGAEKLVGKGDMLFNPMGMGKPIRVQGTYVSDGEVNDVIQFVKGQVENPGAGYNADILTRIERSNGPDGAEEADDLLPEAIDLVVRSGQASVSMLQRRFRIGYNRAARIVDMMEARGIIGPQDGSRPRQVLMTEAELEAMEGELP